MDGLTAEDPGSTEQAFYRAFEEADVDAMMGVWDDALDVCCIHPMGKALTGYEAVRSGWREILSEGPKLRFRLEPLSYLLTGDMAVSIVYERIQVAGEPTARPPMVATNVYRRTSLGWRLVLHHASPAVVAASGLQEDVPFPLH
jgi:ketosteroid isomerase-like protein